MKNRIKFAVFLLIFFTLAAKTDAQTTEIDTIYYYDRYSDDFLIILGCTSQGGCRPITVGFDLLQGYSYSIEEIRISIGKEGKYAFSIHLGTDFPDDSNIIYQDSVLVLPSETHSGIDSVIVFKSIPLSDISELMGLEEKFWIVLDIWQLYMNNRPTPIDSISQHSFSKINISDTAWFPAQLEWVIEAIVKKNTVGVQTESQSELPLDFALRPNYPNPFNSITTITYEIIHSGYVKLIIYDIQGREILRLYDGFRNSGRYEVIWNGLNTEGKEVPSGIYFATLRFNKKSVRSMKLMLLK